MAFNYSSLITEAIRDAKQEDFLAKLDYSPLQLALAEKAKLGNGVDLVSPYDVDSDEQYEALMQATKIYLSNVK